MEQINVNPLSVRGFGDIVDSKVVGDFLEFNSNLSSSSGVYSSSYLTGSNITLSNVRRIGSSDSSFVVSATLKDSTSTVISGATLYCNVNGTVTSETTNASGVASFTISTDDSEKYSILVYYQGTNSVAGSFATSSVYTVGTVDELTLQGNHDVIQSSDTVGLWAKLTDTEGKGIPLVTINFCEEWSPGIRLSASPSIIQSGDTSSVSVQLIDADDGSLVRQSGQTIMFYKEVSDLTRYLCNSNKYIAQDSAVIGVSAGDTSKLSISDNVATLSSTAHVWHTEEFVSQDQYVLEFDGKVTSGSNLYVPFDWGVYIGENKNACVGFNFQAEYFKTTGGNVAFTKRYTDYTHFVITREGNNWNFNVNNGDINYDLTSTGTIKNIFSMVKFSNGSMSVKNLEVHDMGS